MARTRIAKFNIQITASAEQITRVFSNLRKQTSNWRTNLASGLTTASFAFNQITQAVGPVVAKFQEMAAELDELAKTAARLRIPPEFLQTLELAGGRLGIELQTINTGLRDLQDRIGDLRRGAASKQLGDAFAQIGLGNGNLSTELATAFLQVREGLASIEDQSIKASVAAELFGRAGKELLLIFEGDALRQAAEDIDAVNGAFSQEQLARIEQFNDAWADITRTLKSLWQRLVIEIAPALKTVAEWLQRLIEYYFQLARNPIVNRLLRALPGQAPIAAIAGMEPAGSATGALARIQPVGETEVRRIMTKQLEALRAVQRNTEDTLGIVQTGVN